MNYMFITFIFKHAKINQSILLFLINHTDCFILVVSIFLCYSSILMATLIWPHPSISLGTPHLECQETAEKST